MSASDDAPRRPLAVTMGEPAGIGGELTLAAWMRRADLALPAFLALDDPDRLAGIARKLGWQVPIREIASASDALTAFEDALPVLPVRLPSPATPGRPDPAHAGAVPPLPRHSGQGVCR